MLKGAYEGDDKLVAQALRDNACIEAKEERMRTALALATENGHKNIVKLLLAHGADPNCLDNEVISLLILYYMYPLL